MEPRVLFIAMGVKKWNDGSRHVVCCGVFHTEKEAVEQLEKNHIPIGHRNIVTVFENLGHCINVFALKDQVAI